MDFKSINAVIFDFDNTLVYTRKLVFNIDSEILRSMAKDYKISFSKLSDIYNSVRRTYNINSPDKDRGYWFKFMLNKLGIKAKASDTAKYRDQFYSSLLQREKLVPYAKQFISRLKRDGKKVGILTSLDAVKGFKLKRIQHLGISKYVDKIIIGGETCRIKKEDAKIFRFAARKIGEKPENILMVGDDIKHDIKGARAVGMYTALITDSNIFDKNDSDLVFRSIQDLFKFYVKSMKH